MGGRRRANCPPEASEVPFDRVNDKLARSCELTVMSKVDEINEDNLKSW